MSFVKNVAVSFSTKIGLFLLGTIINVIMARMLGPEGKGVYTLTLLIGSTLFMIGNFGMTSSVIYFVGKGKYELKVIVSNVLTLGLITGAILSLTTIVIAYNFSIPFLRGVNPLFIALVSLSVPVTLVRSYLNSVSLGKQKITSYSLIQIIEKIIFLLNFFILFIFSKSLIANAVISNIVAAIGAGIVSLFFVSKMTKIVLGIQRAFMVAATKYGLKVYFANMMLFGEKKIDVFLINFFLNPTMVGYYSLATGLAEFLNFIPQAIFLSLYPKLSSSSKKEIKEYTPKVCRHMIFVMVIGCLFMGSVSEIIIKVVYGKVFLPALPVLWVFLPGIIFAAISKVLLSDILSRGRPMMSTIASGVGVFSSVILNFLLIPIWGMSGAAAAGVISYFSVFLILLIFYLKISENRWIDVIVFTRDDLMFYFDMIKKTLVKGKRINHEN